MPRRHGATLIEVLVAIFIMGIGLMALLTLFPLGALRMAKAIRDERCVQSAQAAANIANLASIRNSIMATEAMLGRSFPTPLPTDPKAPDPNGRGYPVFVDPLGYAMAFGTSQKFVAGFQANLAANAFTPGLRRVYPVELINNPATASQVFPWFLLLDELIFEGVLPNQPFEDVVGYNGILNAGEDTNGNGVLDMGGPRGYPKQLIPGTVERDPRYSWAYLLQRPRASDPTAVECAVVVFSGRPLNLTGNLTLPETLYAGYDFKLNVPEVSYDPASSMARVRWEFFNSVEPQVRSGDWILDASTVRGETRCYFYRVAAVTDATDGATGMRCVDFELQQPLRDFPQFPQGPQIWSSTGTFSGPTLAYPTDMPRLIVLEGVAEVFERGLGRGQ